MFTHSRQSRTWQDRRIEAMNRAIFRRILPHWYLVEEYVAVSNSKHKTKQDYKREVYKNDSY